MLKKGDKVDENQVRCLQAVFQGKMAEVDIFERTSTWSIVTDTYDRKDVPVHEDMVGLSHEEILDHYDDVPPWLRDYVRVKEDTKSIVDENGCRTLNRDLTDDFLEGVIYSLAGPRVAVEGGPQGGWSTKRGHDALQVLGYDRLIRTIFVPPNRENPIRPMLKPKVSF